MAGIGFELRKLFVGRGVARKINAYAYSSIVCAGTMILANILLISVDRLTHWYSASQHEADTLVVMLLYALGASLLLSAPLQILLSRFVADQLYMGEEERVIPSLIGAYTTLSLPGGALYALLLYGAPEVPLLDRILNLCLFLVLPLVWLEMSYITAVKEYPRVLQGFAIGVFVAIALTWLLLSLGLPIITAVMLSLFCGYGTMLLLFLRVLLRRFPAGEGSLFYFVAWIGRMPDLVITGFSTTLGAYIHIILMWFSPIGYTVISGFYNAPMHDTAAFFAFLITVPASVQFMVSVEVNFYQKYKAYFNAISGGGTMLEITALGDEMAASLKHELSRLTQMQVYLMIIYAVLMRYALETIGFTHGMISMFQMMCVGYSAFALVNCLVLLMLYFNDRTGAMTTAGTFLLINFTASLLTTRGSTVFYDTGLVAAGVVAYIMGAFRLLGYVKEIDYHVFCGQPIFATKSKNILERLAETLDHKVRATHVKPTPRRILKEVKPHE